MHLSIMIQIRNFTVSFPLSLIILLSSASLVSPASRKPSPFSLCFMTLHTCVVSVSHHQRQNQMSNFFSMFQKRQNANVTPICFLSLSLSLSLSFKPKQLQWTSWMSRPTWYKPPARRPSVSPSPVIPKKLRVYNDGTVQ